MSTSATPLSHSPAPPLSHSQASARWQPDGDTHLIYRWVKFEGKSQSWVAAAFGISQSTVSRILQRYERWQAHAKEREDGRLDRAERVRAQRWLTFERNELILASCLRIAGDLEGSLDTSRSTILHHASKPERELEVRTHHACIDRTGTVSRFLRLAHRINMEQLKLAELAEPPAADELSPEELAAEEAQAAADAAELAAARRRGADIPVCRSEEAGDREQETGNRGQETVSGEAESQSGGETAETTHHSPTHHSPAAGDLHNLHNEKPPEIAATTSQPCTCVVQARIHKNARGVCITEESSSAVFDETSPPEEERNSPKTADAIPAASSAV